MLLNNKKVKNMSSISIVSFNIQESNEGNKSVSTVVETTSNNLEAAKRFREKLVFSYSDHDLDAPSIIPLNFRQLTKVYLLFKGIH